MCAWRKHSLKSMPQALPPLAVWDRPLFVKNVVGTPHTSGTTRQAQIGTLSVRIEKLKTSIRSWQGLSQPGVNRIWLPVVRPVLRQTGTKPPGQQPPGLNDLSAKQPYWCDTRRNERGAGYLWGKGTTDRRRRQPLVAASQRQALALVLHTTPAEGLRGTG